MKNASEPVPVLDTLLDRIGDHGAGPHENAQSREIIRGFVSDAITPVHRRLREELADGRWAWRSIHALAGKAGADEQSVLDILRGDADIDLSRAKSGKTIAHLKTRVSG